jgi:ribulose-5-phosphate 4-epimerase/fuculose-1-phosphate aldolase
MPHATAITGVQGGRLAWCHQNALRFWDRVAYDDSYGGVVLDETEGRRIAGNLDGKEILFMASHGITIVGPTMAWAFDDMYYLERACQVQVIADSTGRPGAPVPAEMADLVASQVQGERLQSELFFKALRRKL